jgi:hypothetical protein
MPNPTTFLARLRRRKPVPSALEQRDEWLKWMLLGGSKQSTVDGYPHDSHDFAYDGETFRCSGDDFPPDDEGGNR